MSSLRKVKANRANARASTGPKTKQGRARSAQNSLRHGLSLPVYSDPMLSEEVEALAREIAGSDANGNIQQLARRVAEAQIDLLRVRYARYRLLSKALAEPYYESRASSQEKGRLVIQCLQKKVIDIPLKALERLLISTPQGPHKIATIFSKEVKQLSAFECYERRALSRRKFAIRNLDEARGA